MDPGQELESSSSNPVAADAIMEGPNESSDEPMLQSIIDSFAANLEEIVGFASHHLDRECNELSEQIKGASTYVEECTLRTNNRTNFFVSNLLSNINALRNLAEQEDIQRSDPPLLESSIDSNSAGESLEKGSAES